MQCGPPGKKTWWAKVRLLFFVEASPQKEVVKGWTSPPPEAAEVLRGLTGRYVCGGVYLTEEPKPWERSLVHVRLLKNVEMPEARGAAIESGGARNLMREAVIR